MASYPYKYVYDDRVEAGTALAAAAVYTGPWQETVFAPDITDLADTDIPALGTDKRRLEGYIIADQASAAGGVVVDYSVNGATALFTTTLGALAAGLPFFIDLPLLAKFMRLRVTNGAVAQAVFVVQLFLAQDA